MDVWHLRISMESNRSWLTRFTPTGPILLETGNQEATSFDYFPDSGMTAEENLWTGKKGHIECAPFARIARGSVRPS